MVQTISEYTQHCFDGDAKMSDSTALLKVKVTRTSDACPFLNPELGFSLRAGDILWLRGASGSGKTTICTHIAGLASVPGAHVHLVWEASVPLAQRVGFLFQKGVLIDSLNLAENLALALRAGGEPYPPSVIGEALRAVGLDTSDGSKMPGQARASHACATESLAHSTHRF